MTLVLPSYQGVPIGGFKVAYEYANGLARRNHEVTVVHPRKHEPPTQPLEHLKARLWPYRMRVRDGRLVPWFAFHPRVRLLLVRDLSSRFIPEADAIVATAWQTAEQVNMYPATKGRKFHLVHDYEFYMTEPPEIRMRMQRTFRAGRCPIATSSAVAEMLRDAGVSAAPVIRAGVDHSLYQIEVPIAERRWGLIVFPYRSTWFKGAGDAIEAIGSLRSAYGDSLQVCGFGSEPPPLLPPWIDYRYRPSDLALKQLYNSASIFILPSHYEGWGLPGIEALACGAGLVTTDSGGVRDFAIDRVTALVVPPGRPYRLADAVRQLLDDEALRVRLAHAGNCHVQQYTWPTAVQHLERLLLDGSPQPD